MKYITLIVNVTRDSQWLKMELHMVCIFENKDTDASWFCRIRAGLYGRYRQ